MKKSYVSILAGIGLVFTSCGDFLQEYSQDLVYASSMTDLSELLVGEGYAASDRVVGRDVDFYAIHLMDDDVTESVVDYLYSDDNRMDNGFYCYKEQPFESYGKPIDDEVWKGVYKKLGALNTIIEETEHFRGEEGYAKVQGEAYYLRACWYFWLVNLYAKPYAKTTAIDEPGVPMKLTNYIEDRYFSRATVQQVYEQIVNDLTIAVDHLKTVREASVYRANETAARILLSRVYLYMNEWQLAFDMLKDVSAGYQLKNLNLEDLKTSFTNADSQETVFSMGGNPVFSFIMRVDSYFPVMPGWVFPVGFSYAVNADLLSLYEPGDLRKDAFFSCPPDYPSVTLASKLLKNDTRIVSDRFLIRYAEVYLNRAEALVMLGEEGEAIKIIQDFRKTRFKEGNVGAIDKTGKDLIELIRKERRLEFCFEGHRWFDIRRYAVCSKYPENKPIVHSYTVWDKAVGRPARLGEYVLPAYSEDSDNYVLPIPDYAIRFNQGMLKGNNRKNIGMTH